jgi:hypothetical protein
MEKEVPIKTNTPAKIPEPMTQATKGIAPNPDTPTRIPKPVAQQSTPTTTPKPVAQSTKKIIPNPIAQSTKKTTPKINPLAKTPEYKNVKGIPAGKSESIIPKHLIPTKRFATILGIIFLAVVIFSLVKLPYGDLLQGNLQIKIGYPLSFLELGTDTIDVSPVKIKGLTIDLILYLILSYIIDILINLMLATNLTRIRKVQGKGVKVFKPISK